MTARIISVLFMFGTLPSLGQSAAVPALVVRLPAVVMPYTTIYCPINGKTAMCTFPQKTLLAAGQTSTTPVTAPVSMSGFTAAFTCNVPPDSTVITNPDGTKTITGVVCSLVTK